MLGKRKIKKPFLNLSLALIASSMLNPSYGIPQFCTNTQEELCAIHLSEYPLFDSEAKIAANYVPVLPLRAFAHAEIYQKKKTVRLKRFFYIKDLNGALGEAYEILDIVINIKGDGLLEREILAIGKLNEFDVEYKNKIKASLPKRATMKAIAKIANVKFLDLDIKSDGQALTNDVKGILFAKKVDYKTKWRNSSGLLGGSIYEIYTEGSSKNSNHFEVKCNGKIGTTEIKGHGKLVRPNYYEFEETYGHILVKSQVTVI